MTNTHLMESLLLEIKQELSIERLFAFRKGNKVDVSLVNHFRLHETIPNKWFDWVNRAEAPIMIIGQDWGPYAVLQKYVERYETQRKEANFDYDKFLFSTFSSRTEKFIVKAVESTYEKHYGKRFTPELWKQFFFTMAVLFTRQGKHFRGNANFDEKKSAALSYPYVKQQIDIVNPKVILTFGNLAFGVVNQYFKLGYEKIKISQIIDANKEVGYIKVGDTIIIPNYHPAAHVDPKIQMGIWEKLWELAQFKKIRS